MKFIDLLYTLLSVILSTIIFIIVLNPLNEGMLKLFVPLHKLVSKVKKKKLFRSIIFVISLLLCVAIKDFLNLE